MKLEFIDRDEMGFCENFHASIQWGCDEVEARLSRYVFGNNIHWVSQRIGDDKASLIMPYNKAYKGYEKAYAEYKQLNLEEKLKRIINGE